MAQSQGSASVMNVSGAEGDRLLSRPPHVRGFWTDEELLAETGLGSIPLLKKVQATRWLWPNYLPIPGGGRRRVWPSAEVVRAAILAALVRATAINTLGVATLLVRLGVGWVDGAVQVRSRLDGLKRDPLSAGTRLVIVDFSEAWAEQPNGDLRLMSQGMQLQGSRPEAPQVNGKPVFRLPQVVTDAGITVMTVRMSGLLVPAIAAVAGREPQSVVAHGSRQPPEQE